MSDSTGAACFCASGTLSLLLSLMAACIIKHNQTPVRTCLVSKEPWVFFFCFYFLFLFSFYCFFVCFYTGFASLPPRICARHDSQI